MNHPLVKLNNDQPDSRWLIFPTANLLALYQRRTRGSWGYVNTWRDAQGFGLHCITWERLAATSGIPNQPRPRQFATRMEPVCLSTAAVCCLPNNHAGPHLACDEALHDAEHICSHVGGPF